MRLHLLPLLLLVLQDPPPDDIGAKFHSLPTHRQWELAEAYYRQIAECLRAGDYDAARLWDRRARDRMAAGFRNRLTELGRDFWPELRGFPGNRSQVEFKALQIVHALTSGVKADLGLIRKGAEENKVPPDHVHFRKVNLALARACDDDVAGARDILDQLEKEKPGDAQLRDLATAREQIDALRNAADAVAEIAAMSHLAARSRSAGPGFATLRRILRLLKEPLEKGDRKNLEDAAVQGLRSLGDPEGSLALEATFQERLADEKTPLQERASKAYQRGDYEAAEEAYRTLVRKFPGNPAVAEWLFFLGKSLKFLGKPAEARAVFAQILTLDDEGKKPAERFARSYKHRADYEIPGCLEAEEKWSDAFKHWTRLRDERPPTDREDQLRDLEVFEGLQRCRLALKRNEEALLAYEEYLRSEKGMASHAIAAAYVDLAIKLERFQEADRRMAAPGFTRGVEAAREYIHLLKLRQARDARALFDFACKWPPETGNARRWSDCRSRSGWLGAEAIECLAELGDAAIDLLLPLVQLKVGHDHLALIALARVRSERSHKILADMDWTKSLGRDRIDQARALSLDPPRGGGRLPEKPAPAADPAADARKKDVAARIRERLPELIGRVKGIEEFLAEGTAEGRWRALGETVMAWKKGAIVDEDFGDLVALAIEENWKLPPKTLLELVRENRAGPAAPLLIPLLDSADSEIRGGAAQQLGQLRHHACVPAIAALIKDLDPAVSNRAIEALVALEARSEIPAVAERLAAAIPEARKAVALWALGRLKARDRAAEIAPFLKSEDAKCRARAAEALGLLGGAAYVDQIKALLKDPDEGVRMAAQGALKRLDNPK